jgi:hypothetical protein
MRLGQRILLSAALGMLLASSEAVLAADPEIDKLVQSPVGKDWVTNGGNLTNQRYSTLKQIDTSKRQTAQRGLDDPPQGLRLWREIFIRGDAPR